MKNVYVIVDVVSHEHSPLFICATDESARRQFGTFLRDMKHSPTDFNMYKVGTFDMDGTSPSLDVLSANDPVNLRGGIVANGSEITMAERLREPDDERKSI